MIAARQGTSAIHQQGALRAQRAQLPMEKVSVGDRQWQAVENKWGKATILMLSIGADVCRTAGNDLLALKNNWETEVSESRTDFAEPCPSPLPLRSTHTSTQAPEQHGSLGLGDGFGTPCCPCSVLPTRILRGPPVLMSSSASHRAACCHHIWPLIPSCHCHQGFCCVCVGMWTSAFSP